MGTAVYVLESDEHSGFSSIPRSIYWAIVTVTTVGYGDIAPQSVPGQALASMMMVCGYALLAVPTGIAAAEYSRASVTRAGRARSRERARRGAAAARMARGGLMAPSSAGGLDGRGTVLMRVCDSCEATGHDVDALYCKHCGEPLDDGC